MLHTPQDKGHQGSRWALESPLGTAPAAPVLLRVSVNPEGPPHLALWGTAQDLAALTSVSDNRTGTEGSLNLPFQSCLQPARDCTLLSLCFLLGEMVKSLVLGRCED